MEDLKKSPVPNFSPLEVYFKRRNLWGMLFMVTLLLLGCCISIVLFIQSWMTWIVIGLIGPFLVLIILFLVENLYKNKPALRIDKEGIFENSNLMSVGMIEWGQIEQIRPDSINGINSLKIILREPQYFIRKESNWLKRGIMTINWKFDSTPIHITDMLLSIKFVELVQEISQRQWEGSPFQDFSEHLID